MNSPAKSNTHYETKDNNGVTVLCPIGTGDERKSEECVEEDVVRRYSGNIRVQTAFLKGESHD